MADRPDPTALAALWLGTDLPAECVSGVADNLAALADHIAAFRSVLADRQIEEDR
jgi:hypothetical protein